MAVTYGNITLASGSSSNWSIGTALPSTTATWTTTMPSGGYTLNTGLSSAGNVKITGNGIDMVEGTDLVIGGKSIKKSLEAIESRLAIMSANHEVEAEWEELKRLGDAYRALEAEIQEKMKTWNILKKDI